ncbi:hypothetical protein [Corynebacterium cystitidis]|uniref:hypothetical protein n=1 Tax=Corynebacterium cystitidis TaxID=35757 RepID=UPI0027B9BF45|nr:hypothetical protein [Corynebacterium cystitidis]
MTTKASRFLYWSPPHIDGNWNLAKDKSTRVFLAEQRDAGQTLILNGFETDIFAPPRWRLSTGALQVLPEFGFSKAASTSGLVHLESGRVLEARTLSVGEGYGAAKWWRRSVIKAAERGANRGNSVWLSISGRNLAEKKVARDFIAAAVAAADAGATPSDYQLLNR